MKVQQIVWGLITKAMPRGLNGRVDVILNNPKHTYSIRRRRKQCRRNRKRILSLPVKREVKEFYLK